ncbi:MAG: hypothetical protein AB1736_04485 [Chloroflexota bacterium]
MTARHHCRTGLLNALAVALLVAACGGSASVAPSPTPTPEPTPSATPFDVVAAFLEVVQDEDFSGRIELAGTMELGVTATISGEMSGSGADSRTLMEITFGGTTTESETITANGRTYTRTAPGPWLEVQPEASGADEDSLGEYLQTLSDLEDLGVVTKNGQQLHHLSAGGDPVPPGAMGLDASTYTDPIVTMEFYVAADGTPAIFAVEGSWTQAINGQQIAVEFVMDLTFVDVGSVVRISAPSDVWAMYESPLGYAAAHPAGFTVENREEYDAYIKDGEEWLNVVSWPEATGLNVDGFLAEILAITDESWGQPTATIETSLAGEPAYLARFEFTYDDGSAGVAYDVVAMHENVGWEVTLYTLPELEQDDAEFLDEFLATFHYGE